MFKIHRRITRHNYWSNSWLVEKIRTKIGLPIPKTMTAAQWDEYRTECKKTPVRNWLTDDLVGHVQDVVMFIPDCIEAIRIFFKNWKGQTHVLHGGFPRGEWVDLSQRINVCLFHMLEEYIEKEKGIDLHEWEKTLVWDESCGHNEHSEGYGKPTDQALSAMEQDVIYKWWKENKGRDFYKEAGWDNLETDTSAIFQPLTEEREACYDLANKLEDQFKQEEEEMLIRLIKCRDTLWS